MLQPTKIGWHECYRAHQPAKHNDNHKNGATENSGDEGAKGILAIDAAQPQMARYKQPPQKVGLREAHGSHGSRCDDEATAATGARDSKRKVGHGGNSQPYRRPPRRAAPHWSPRSEGLGRRGEVLDAGPRGEWVFRRFRIWKRGERSKDCTRDLAAARRRPAKCEGGCQRAAEPQQAGDRKLKLDPSSSEPETARHQLEPEFGLSLSLSIGQSLAKLVESSSLLGNRLNFQSSRA